MKLSVVIVNYNVKFFLEQCLQTVFNALKDIEGEVFVVDNNSVDGSCQMVKERFPQVNLIRNHENLGFSKANNQAIRQCKGQYILLLNPDTLVQEDTFAKCTAFMDQNSDAGGLGVKMIDGKGNFLPESKRGLPTPWVSFCKIFGLSLLFPKSKLFAKYHLGYLDKDKTNAVDVLPGAFMLLRKETLDITGLLDESFFMYGEDIDLSYRITKAGYKNIYFPEATIIHYKGESTKKGSINYVLVFYNAMIIFARKHFSNRYAGFYSLIINLAIYFRAFLSIIKRIVSLLLFPALDATVIFLGYLSIEQQWEIYKFGNQGIYPPVFLNAVVPAYIIAWLGSIFINGGYSKPYKMNKIRRGIITGTVAILLIYALLPEGLRFSRALILLGAAYTLVVTHALRIFFNLLNIKSFNTEFKKRRKRIVIVGDTSEANRVYSILKHSHIVPDLAGNVSPGIANGNGYIGNIGQLAEIIRVHDIEEIIFCGKNITSQEIIRNMLLLSDESIDFKIAPPESESVIGSNSIDTSGELYTITFNSVAKPSNKRKKRFFDMILSALLIILSPILALFFGSARKFFLNLVGIIRGKLSFVGYEIPGQDKKDNYRVKGVFYPDHILHSAAETTGLTGRLNHEYTQNYSVMNDFSIVVKNFFSLDREP